MTKTNNHSSYQDFILKQPKSVKIIKDEDTLKMIKKHSVIISKLREGPLTVKEIHQLYYEPDSEEADSNGYLVSLKTVYRRLKRLSKINLVMVAGHRKTKGSNFTEKLFSRTAKVFFVLTDQSLFDNWDAKQTKQFGKRAMDLVSRFYDTEIPSSMKSLLKETLGNFPKERRKIHEKLAEKASKDEQMADIFVDLDIQEISALVRTVTTFIALANRSENIKKLLELKESIETKTNE